MQMWAEPRKSALPIRNDSQILYQFLMFTQNLKRSPYFLSQTKNKSEQSELCSDVSKPHEKDIFAFSAVGFEPSKSFLS